MSWLQRIREAVSAQPGGTVNVREALLAAAESRARLDVISLAAHSPEKLVTTIEQVRESDFIISQPVAGGSVRPISRFEQLQVTFLTSQGRVSGDTENVGRIRIEAGDGGELYGYRLSIPSCLTYCDRRSELRVVLGEDLLCEARLQVLTRNGPVVGLIEDISASGARIRCRNAGEHLVRDRPAHFEADLSEPLGTIQQIVRILGAETDPQTGERIVRVVFDEKIEAIDELLREGQRRSA